MLVTRQVGGGRVGGACDWRLWRPAGEDKETVLNGGGIRIRRRCLRGGPKSPKKLDGWRRRVLAVVLVLVVVCSGQQPWADRIWGEVERELGSAAKAKSRRQQEREAAQPGTGLAAGTGTGAVAGEKGVYIPSWGWRAGQYGVPGYTHIQHSSTSRNWRPPLVGRQWSRVCEVAPDQLTAQSLGISTPVSCTATLLQYVREAICTWLQ